MVRRCLDKGRQPGLQTGGCESRYVGASAAVVVLDEVVFA